MTWSLFCVDYGLPSLLLQRLDTVGMISGWEASKECTETLHVFENYWRACKNPFWEFLFFSTQKNAKPPHATSGYFRQTQFWRKWLCDRCFFWGSYVAPRSSSPHLWRGRQCASCSRRGAPHQWAFVHCWIRRRCCNRNKHQKRRKGGIFPHED